MSFNSRNKVVKENLITLLRNVEIYGLLFKEYERELILFF